MELFTCAGSSSVLTFISVLMFKVHEICPGLWQKNFLAMFGLLTIFAMAFEFGMLLLNAMTAFDHAPCTTLASRCVNQGLRIASMTLFFTRLIAIFVPPSSYTSLIQELCEWKGQTLFESSYWIGLVLVPSMILVLIPMLKTVMHFNGLPMPTINQGVVELIKQ